ncbi:MAG: DUF4330 domain-containing protein [Clostridia bacterium]|nr:DUF4330 domain-containing protein [Clostridia bacterium]
MKKTSKNCMNVIDIIIIAVFVLAAAAAGFIFLRPGNTQAQATQYVDFTIELPTIKNKFEGVIKKGDPVLETVRHAAMGEILDVVYENASIATTDMQNNGVMIMADYPDHKKVTVVIRAPYGINENGEYTVAGTALAVGAYINFSTPDFINSGYCTRIEFPDAEENLEWQNYLNSKKG